MTDFIRYPSHLLPLPQLSGYRVQRNYGVVRVPMASGRTRNRRKWNNAPGQLPQLDFIFTSEQLQIFEGWVFYALDAGAADFILPVKTASGIADHVCRFTEDPQTSAITGNRWKVSVKAEVDGLEFMNENTLVSLISGVENAAEQVTGALTEAADDYVTPESN